MTLAKAFVTGVVTKTPEKRFTQNDMAIAAFSLNIDANTNTILRVTAFGQLAETVANSISEGDSVVVEGRLQVNSYKLPNGKDKKVFEISASTIEKMSASAMAASSATQPSDQNIVTFDETADTAGDLIDEDEIPF